MGRTLKSARNLKYSMIYQALDVVLKFAMRTALVYSLGDAVVGLNGLFTEVLSMLSMAEMGVGASIIYSLYKPLANNDVPKIKQLMALYKRAYQIIAVVIFGVGLALLPFIHLLVHKVDFDPGYIRLVYLLFLTSTSVSYLFTYKASLFNADQNTYRITRIKLVVNTVWTVAKILVLLYVRNFLLFLCMDVLMKLTQNVLFTMAANRAYPYLREKSELPDKAERRVIFANIGHIFVGKVSGEVTSSTDNVLISVMDSLIAVGHYSNYAMIINNARTFLLQIVSSAVGGIGNLLVVDRARCYVTLKRLTFLMFLCGALVCSAFYGVLSRLVALWLGPQRVLTNPVVAVLLFNLLLFSVREPLWQFMSASGQFKKDKYISIAGTIVNLIVSVVLGQRMGMLGIFIGTTATLVIQFVLKAILLCKAVLSVSPVGFLGLSGAYLLTATGTAWLCRLICDRMALGNPVLDILAGIAVSLAVTAAAVLVVYFKSPEMKYFFGLLQKGLNRLNKRRQTV